jgi:hypothetical protein
MVIGVVTVSTGAIMRIAAAVQGTIQRQSGIRLLTDAHPLGQSAGEGGEGMPDFTTNFLTGMNDTALKPKGVRHTK